jgi:hypothetical protein
VGHVDDFVVDTENWRIAFMVVTTGNWLPGQKVMVAPLAIKEIDWPRQELVLSFTTKQVEASPEFEPNEMVNPKIVLIREDHYDRPTV